MTDPTTRPDTTTDEPPMDEARAPLQMLGAADADGCHDGVCAVPGTDEGAEPWTNASA